MVAKVFVRNEFNYDMDEVSKETGLECKDDSRAVQSQAEEADINTIVRRFGLTGTVPATIKLPSYSDFDEIFDFQSALNAVNDANKTFMSLPARVRSQFDNDPQKFLEFVADPQNGEEMVRLGLAEQREIVQNLPSPDGRA